MRRAGAVLALLLAVAAPAAAQGTLGQEKQILAMIRQNWVAFRDYDGKQLIYFTTLLAYHCGLSEIRYSLDSGALDRRFPVPECDPQQPNAIDVEKSGLPFVSLPKGSTREMAVQLVYSDGSESETVRFAPCDRAGDNACAVLVASDAPPSAPAEAAPIPPSRSGSNGLGQSVTDTQ